MSEHVVSNEAASVMESTLPIRDVIYQYGIYSAGDTSSIRHVQYHYMAKGKENRGSRERGAGSG